jgi:hypothetical protein
MSKHSAMPARRVWRISADAPQGEYVDSRADDGKRAEPRHRTDAEPTTSLMTSSIDLAQGLDVIDSTDSISHESFDRLFGR